MPATPCRADRGSGPVTALMVMGILALVFAIGLTALFAAAGAERSTAQHAADAAALAGAQGVLDDAPAALAPGFVTPADIPLLLGGSVCAQTGRVEAFRLAQANHASLTSYCYDVFADTVRVSVRLDDSTVADTRASADAEAATTFEAGRCALDPGFRVPEEPDPAPEPAPEEEDPAPEEAEAAPPQPPAPVSTTLDCGFGPLAVIFRPALARFFFLDLEAQLADLRPRLTA